MVDAPIPFHRRTAVRDELEAVRRTLESGPLSGGGPASAASEAMVSDRLAGRPTFLTGSASSALELAALALRIGPGDEVVVASFGFPTTASAFALRGAQLRFADVEPRWLGIDPASVERLLTPRTRAVVVIHYASQAAELGGLVDLCGDQVALIEDIAQAFPSTWNGTPLGTFGQMAALSFHDTKVVAAGEAGALVVEPRHTELVEILRDKGTDRSRFMRGEVDRYVWQEVGGSHLPSEMQAALLAAQLGELDRVVTRRTVVWQRYFDGLSGWIERHGFETTIPDPARNLPFQQFHLVVESPDDREGLSAHLADNGIDSRFHFQPLHQSPAARALGAVGDACPVTERVADCLLRLPFFSDLADDEVDRVVDTVTSWRPARSGVSSAR